MFGQGKELYFLLGVDRFNDVSFHSQNAFEKTSSSSLSYMMIILDDDKGDDGSGTFPSHSYLSIRWDICDSSPSAQE
jgi:hypothetical protein